MLPYQFRALLCTVLPPWAWVPPSLPSTPGPCLPSAASLIPLGRGPGAHLQEISYLVKKLRAMVGDRTFLEAYEHTGGREGSSSPGLIQQTATLYNVCLSVSLIILIKIKISSSSSSKGVQE